MKTIKFVVIIFFDGMGNVLVQKRGTKSRNNEKYALWGGRVEKGETEEEAMKRELVEELGFIPKVLNKCNKYNFNIEEGVHKGKRIMYRVFLSPITKGLMETRVLEGEKMIMFKAVDVVNNKEFFQGDRDLFSQLISEGKLLTK